jgi:hypothetical protein
VAPSHLTDYDPEVADKFIDLYAALLEVREKRGKCFK